MGVLLGLVRIQGGSAVASVEASKAPHYCKFDVQGWQVCFRASVLVREGAGTISALPAQ
jgi:hypothetical protein